MDYVDETQGEYTPRNPNLYYQGDEWLDWWMLDVGGRSFLGYLHFEASRDPY
jgi:hypothetical protein